MAPVPCTRRDEVEAVLDWSMELLSNHTCMVFSACTHSGKTNMNGTRRAEVVASTTLCTTVSFDATAFIELDRNLQQLQNMLGTLKQRMNSSSIGCRDTHLIARVK